MKKKALALLMCGAMIAGTLAGCGNSEPAAESKAPASSEAKTESSAAPASSEAAEEPVEPVEVKWLGYYTSNITISEDSFGENLINENCPWIKVEAVTDVAAENFDAWMASGEIFDITCFCAYISGGNYAKIKEYYDDEIIREIPEEYLWEYYPTGMQNLIDYLGQDFFDKGRHLNSGMLLNIPAITTQNTAKGTLVYRKDWADKLGIAEPTSLDEFHDMLYAFTYDDPDGNGADDTYGMSGVVNYLNYCSAPFFGPYGFASPTTYYKNDDGSIQYWGATEGYKEGLRLMKEWYDEGIIDPEAITDDRSAMRVKWADGKLGVMGDSATWMWSNRGPSGVVGMVEDVFGEGVIAPIGPMTSEYKGQTLGETGMVQMTNKFFNTYTNIGMMFTADATDEQIIAVLKMLEVFAVDEDLHRQLQYGEEGVDWDMVDGVIALKDHVSVEYQASKGIDTFFDVMAKSQDYHKLTLSARDNEMNEKFYATPTDCAPTANNFEGASELANQYGAEVNKVQSEFHAAVLLGNKDLDADWDAYIAQLSAAGLDKIIADYEAIAQ